MSVYEKRGVQVCDLTDDDGANGLSPAELVDWFETMVRGVESMSAECANACARGCRMEADWDRQLAGEPGDTRGFRCMWARESTIQRFREQLITRMELVRWKAGA